MPFKRKGSPYYYIRPVVKGFGRVGKWSTGVRDMETARSIESMIQALPLRGYKAVVQLIVDGEVDVQDVWIAHLENRLDALQDQAEDPPLENAITGAESHVTDDRVLTGLRNLRRLVATLSGAAAPRFSWLRDPDNVLALLRAREKEGLKRNSVRRSLYRAISEVLVHALGEAKKDEIMAQVRFPTENDERKFVWLNPDEIERLVGACTDPLFRCFVSLAVLSGIDRGPLLRIQPRHFDEKRGELGVLDTKNASRPRRIELGEKAQTALRQATQLTGAGAAERVFDWTVSQVRVRWDAAREDAGLDWLRFKDLRAVFATYYLLAGGSPKDLMAILGHSEYETTVRYVKRLPIEKGQSMGAAEKQMGFVPHLEIEEKAG